MGIFLVSFQLCVHLHVHKPIPLFPRIASHGVKWENKTCKLRACLHGGRMTLLGGSPFYKGQKIALLYMQSLVPRAIIITEFGAEGDNCTVAKYKATKMIL